MKSFASICFVIVATTTLSAEALLPQTLRQLTEQSNLIVVGRVEAIDQNCSDPAIAKLRVIETIKGAEVETVNVTFCPGTICPAPAAYNKEDIVVAFLRTSDAVTFTTGRSFGAKVLPKKQRTACVKRIREYLTLTGTDDKQLKTKRVTSWLMKCLEDPSTRWEGLRELGEAATISLKDKSRSSNYLEHLTAANKRSMLELLKSLPSDDNGARLERRTLLRVLAASSSDKAIRFIATRLFDLKHDFSLGRDGAVKKYREEETKIFASFLQRSTTR